MSVAPLSRRPDDVAARLALVEAALDDVEVPEGIVGELEDLVARIDRSLRRLASLRLRLVSQGAHERVHERTGHTDTGAWLAQITHADGDDAAREVRLATALDTAPTTGVALGRGELSPAHARVITDALGRLPHLSEPARQRVEEHLVARGRDLSPSRLRRVARRALDVVERDPHIVDVEHERQLRAEESAAYDAVRLTLHDNRDGTTTGRFVIPTLQAGMLSKLLDAMTSPRRARLGAPNAHTDGGVATDPERFPRLRGQALCELVEHLPTDRIASQVNATVLVTIPLDRLRGEVGAAGLDTGDELSAGQARRLACGAHLLPAVLGTRSQVLDLGRRRRLFTEVQHHALSLRHEVCAADGCERPFAWCELHHRQPWSRGGSTDLVNASPLCWFHHRRVHDPEYECHWSADGTLRLRRAST